MIVSPVPHTTREPIDTELSYQGRRITLVDTAGISRRGQQSARRRSYRETLEKFSILKSLAAVKRADIAILVIDINEPITRQETRLLEAVVSRGVGLAIVANKWDLVPDRNTKHYTELIYSHFPFATWTPIQFVSALTGAKVNKLFTLVLEIASARENRISDSSLGKFLGQLIKRHSPPARAGNKRPHIYEIKQTGVNPPAFMVRVGPRDSLIDSYLRFIENRLREKFGFEGTPIKIYVEKERKIHGKHTTENIQ